MRSEEEIREMLAFTKDAPNKPEFNYREGWFYALNWVLGDD